MPKTNYDADGMKLYNIIYCLVTFEMTQLDLILSNEGLHSWYTYSA